MKSLLKWEFLLIIFFQFANLVKPYSQINPKAEILGDLKVEGKVFQSQEPADSNDLVTKAYMDKVILGFAANLGGNAVQLLLNSGYDPADILKYNPNYYQFIGMQYGGGTIVHIDSEGHGFIAKKIENTLEDWGCNGTDLTNAEGEELGTGKLNTQVIVQACREFGAARFMDDYSFDGYNDWFLPSKDEIRLIYVNDISGLYTYDADNLFHWTSTEIDGQTAYAYNYWNSVSEPLGKQRIAYLVAFRSF